jgi:hypothetical protein
LNQPCGKTISGRYTHVGFNDDNDTMKKPYKISIFVPIAFALLLSSCGDDSTDQSEGSGATASITKPIPLPKLLPDPLRMSVSVETVAEISRNRIGPVVMDTHNKHYVHWQLRGDHTELCLDGKLFELGEPARVKELGGQNRKDDLTWSERLERDQVAKKTLPEQTYSNAPFAKGFSSDDEIQAPVFSDDGTRLAVISTSGSDFICNVFQRKEEGWSKLDSFYMYSDKPLQFAAHPSLLKWAWLEREQPEYRYEILIQVRDLALGKTEKIKTSQIDFKNVSHINYDRRDYELNFFKYVKLEFSGKLWFKDMSAQGLFFTAHPQFLFVGNELLAGGVDPLIHPVKRPETSDYVFVKEDKNSRWVETKSASSDRYTEISRFFDKDQSSVFFMARDGKLVRIGQINSEDIQMHQTEFDGVEEIVSSSNTEEYYVGENGGGGHDGRWLYKFPTKAVAPWPLLGGNNDSNFGSRNPLPKGFAGIKLIQPNQSEVTEAVNNWMSLPHMVAFAPDGEKCVVKRGKNLSFAANLPEEFRTVPNLPKKDQFEKSSRVIEHDGLYFLSDETTPIPEGGKVASSPWEYLAQFKRCYDAGNFTRETEVNLTQVDGLRPNEELVPLDRTDEMNDVTWTSNESFSFMAMSQNRLLRCNVRLSKN